MKLLFVCTGNICRSPTAHGVFEHLAREAGLSVSVDSAGTHGYHIGEPPDGRTLATAHARGYDFSAQRARKVHPDDFAGFDLIFAMDNGHFRDLEALCPPAHRHKLHLYLHYTLGKQADVPDPYYGGQDGFEHVLDVVEKASQALLKKVGA